MCFKFIFIFILISFQQNFVYSTDQNDSSVNETSNKETEEFNSSDLNKKLHLVPLTDSINNFGAQFINQLNNIDKFSKSNIVFSPLSIVQIFSMIISSAKNDTYEELMNLFGFNEQLQTSENVNNAFRILLDDYEKNKLEKSKRPIKLSLNSIALYSNNFNIKKSFRANLKDNYKADARKIDFSNNDALTAINEFVNSNTNGLIPKLLEKLNPEDKLALVNAFYFKGDWVNQFEKNLVKDRSFFNADKTTTQAKMMFKRSYYDYFEDNDVQSIVLPYLGTKIYFRLNNEFNKFFKF